MLLRIARPADICAVGTYAFGAGTKRLGKRGNQLCSECPRKSDARDVTASYNGAQRVTSYDDDAANMTAATYNGDGVRTSNTVEGTTSNFVWDVTSSVPQLLMDSTDAYLDGPGSTPMAQVNLSSGAVTDLDPGFAWISTGSSCERRRPHCIGCLHSIRDTGDHRRSDEFNAVRFRRRLNRFDRAALSAPSLLRSDAGTQNANSAPRPRAK